MDITRKEMARSCAGAGCRSHRTTGSSTPGGSANRILQENLAESENVGEQVDSCSTASPMQTLADIEQGNWRERLQAKVADLGK